VVSVSACTEATEVDLGGGASTETGAVEAPTSLEVESTLPRWLAPGARLVVAGTAAPGTAVALTSGETELARATAGPGGGFRLVASAPGAGRHRLSVVAGEEDEVALGVLRVRPLVLAAGGDVNPGDAVAEAVASHGADHPWDSVGPVLERADIATVNLEGVASERGSPWPDKAFHFRGPPAILLAAERSAGIDVVTVANNHSLDYGRQAFRDTLRTARRVGIATVGGGASLTGARRPAVLRAGGLRIAFLGYDDIQEDFHASPGSSGTAPADPALIAEDVRAARKRADLVVVWFHWGIELETTPDERQRELAQAALGAGATLVLGAHPHVLQPIERRGRALVAWSLGNFVFEPHSPGTDETGILLVRLGARGVLGHRFRPATIVGVQPRLS
jgi:poly-gamma-glutamate synthesis protein (capsule biosynthesis protein)